MRQARYFYDVDSYSYDYDEIPFAEDGDEAGLRAHVCADLDCADPVAVDLPEKLSTNAFLANGHHLDLEPLGDGFLLTVTDAGLGAVHALYCSDTSCAGMEVTELSGDRFEYENEDGLRTFVGARARERADGTAVIVLREAGEGSVRVLDCEDPACSEYGEATVTGPGWIRPVPGFDLDSQERPQLVTITGLNVSCSSPAWTVDVPRPWRHCWSGSRKHHRTRGWPWTSTTGPTSCGGGTGNPANSPAGTRSRPSTWCVRTPDAEPT